VSRNIETLPATMALSPLEFENFIIQILRLKLLLSSNIPKVEGPGEPLLYEKEEKLWNDIIHTKEIFETSQISLKEFNILEWIPRSPGIYHTKLAEGIRKEATEYVLSDNSQVFDPYGKVRMVLGGIGCLRLNAVPVRSTMLKFLCATSSGYAHKGFIVAMPSDKFQKVGNLLQSKGAAKCNVSGKLCCYPLEVLNFFDEHLYSPEFLGDEKVPLLYLLVDHVSEPTEVQISKLDVTAGVTFRGDVPYVWEILDIFTF
jgi:hypothetical protein